jgi:hypothetical protein
MGMLPAEEPKAPAEPVQARVEAPATAPSQNEQDELAAALEEMEAEQVHQQEEKRKAGR